MAIIFNGAENGLIRWLDDPAATAFFGNRDVCAFRTLTFLPDWKLLFFCPAFISVAVPLRFFRGSRLGCVSVGNMFR